MLLECTFYAWKNKVSLRVAESTLPIFVAAQVHSEPNMQYHSNSSSEIGSFEANKLILITTNPMNEPNIMTWLV